MKIHFITPSRYRPDGKLFKLKKIFFPSPTFPLLATLSSGHEITVINEEVEQIDFNQTPDIVGITAYSHNILRAYEIADQFRKKNVPVVMGGIHVSAMPEEALTHSDTVFIGEADETWPRFLKDFLDGHPQRIYQPDQLSNLENLPVPDYSLLNRSAHWGFGKTKFPSFIKPIYSIQTSRGCPNACDFCTVTNFYGARYRARPVEDVINEIKALNAEICFFIDENIFTSPGRSRELFTQLKPLKIRWVAQASIGAAKDEELVSLAEQSGCVGLLIGLESICEENLKSVGKHIINKIEDYEKHIKTYQKHHIFLDISMIFGFDRDTPDACRQSFAFLKKNRIPYTAWWPLTPFPGTALYQRLKRKNRLIHEKWWLDPVSSRNLFDLKFKIPGMTSSQFKMYFFKYYLDFYSCRNITKRFLFPPVRGAIFNILYSLFLRKIIKNQRKIYR